MSAPDEDDDAPTTPSDWIGAAEVWPNRMARREPPADPMTFFVFRASTDPTLFAVIDLDDVSRLPPCPENGRWVLFKSFAETGQPRIAFSESEAKRDIREQGYHLMKARIETTMAVG